MVYESIKEKAERRNRDYFLRSVAQRVLGQYINGNTSNETFLEATKLLPVQEDLTREQLLGKYTQLSLILNSRDGGKA